MNFQSRKGTVWAQVMGNVEAARPHAEASMCDSGSAAGSPSFDLKAIRASSLDAMMELVFLA